MLSDITIGIKSLEEMSNKAWNYVHNSNAKILKIKLGKDIESDFERIKQIIILVLVHK